MDRTRLLFELLGFGVYLIANDGTVLPRLPHGPITAAMDDGDTIALP